MKIVTNKKKIGIMNLFIFLFLFSGLSVRAQDRTFNLSGTISDLSNNEPLAGVVIRSKTTGKATISSTNGEYGLSSFKSDSIEFSIIGFKKKVIMVRNEAGLNVQLEPENTELNQLVVIGYGTQREADVTSAVKTIESKNFNKGPVTDPAALLKGKVAGLNVSNPSGDPNAQSNIILRGINTIGGATTSPLVIIDGIPGDLSSVSPEDIASISVLKDASATAIYGVRGSNGVIIINTLHPNGEIQQITFNHEISVSTISRQPKLLTAGDYRAQIASGFRDANDDFGTSTNWLKAMEKPFPVSNVSNLTFQGGNSKTNYIASLNYRYLNGIFHQSYHSTFNGRIEVNHSMLNDKLKFNLKMDRSEFRDRPYDYYNWESAIKMNPTEPIFDPDGTYHERPTNFEYINPISNIYNTDRPESAGRSRYSFNIIALPVNGLRLSAMGSYQKHNYLNNSFQNFQNISTIRDNQNGVASTSSGQTIERFINTSAEYSKSFDAHSFSLIAGYEYQDIDNFSSSITNHDFPNDLPTFGFNDIGVGEAQKDGRDVISSGRSRENLISYFGRLSYNYLNKYLLLASFRIDGSSKLFGADHPYGKFPAVQAGWRITEESFMKNQTFFEDLKLRVGYGVTGIAPSQGFLGPALLGYGNYFLNNGSWSRTLGPSQNPNPDLKWEEKHETNIGLDFVLLHGKITGSFDYYSNETKGLLFNYQVPSPPNIFTSTEANVGNMTNKGLEISINYNSKFKNGLEWNSGVSFSTNDNKLKNLSNDLYKSSVDYFTTGGTADPIQTFTNIVRVGRPIGDFYGFKVVGVTDNGYWIYNEPGENDPVQFNDFNHAFGDKQVLGNGLPKYYLNWNNSFSYKNWDLNVSMRGAFHFQILNALRMNYESTGVMNYNRLASSKDKVFGTAVLSKDMPQEFNSYYIENGDFWKIDNITLGYSFNLKNNTVIKGLRTYISTNNTFVFTGYKGTDPEVPVTGLAPGVEARDEYPSIRTFTIGVSAKF